MTTVINFKTDKKIKTQAQKIAGEMGLNLSDILNIYLREFIVKKEIHINLNGDESNPSDELLEAMRDAKKEYAGGKMKGFKDVDSFITHLETL
mgnify:CR=1 FL=1